MFSCNFVITTNVTFLITTYNLNSTDDPPLSQSPVALHSHPEDRGHIFQKHLKGVYGENAVVRVDVNNAQARGRVLVNNEAIDAGTMIDAPVMHGHVKWEEWQQRFSAPETGVKVITWVRDPVERVTSQYYYLVSVLERELDEPGKGLNILSKLMKTFPEFIRNPEGQNVMRRHFGIADLDAHMDFVGVLEHREEDLHRLGQILNWPQFQDHHHNRTEGRPEPTPSEVDLIRAYNQDDIRLYEQVLEWREKGRYLP